MLLNILNRRELFPYGIIPVDRKRIIEDDFRHLLY